jgi:hypothetical protein
MVNIEVLLASGFVVYTWRNTGARFGFAHGAQSLPPPPTTLAPDDALYMVSISYLF